MKPLLKALKARHAIVAAKIDEEQRQPTPDGVRVGALKKIKMSLKEQIAMLERAETAFASGANAIREPFRKPNLAGR
ncbi:YdcH family protein [Peteryoungia desertarenae]|uniref:YdcH family protein n=1 Tax=Peteryoungia desertarenae TaxID=1813451 RepID=A0ABX6QI78_9HYPH|nr:YdcH family protein [Peteryoungia desertarenae]QLF68199.1 YdcH family protein [Peteryoungia desertarenae]